MKLQGDRFYQIPPLASVDLQPILVDRSKQGLPERDAVVPSRHHMKVCGGALRCTPPVPDLGVPADGRIETFFLTHRHAENNAQITAQLVRLRVLHQQEIKQLLAVTAEGSLGGALLGGIVGGLWKGSLVGGGPGAILGAGTCGLGSLCVTLRRQRGNAATRKALDDISAILDFYERLSSNRVNTHTIVEWLVDFERRRPTMSSAARCAFLELQQLLEIQRDAAAVDMMKEFAFKRNAIELRQARSA